MVALRRLAELEQGTASNDAACQVAYLLGELAQAAENGGARRGGSSAPACDCPPPKAAPVEASQASTLDLKRGNETSLQLTGNPSFFARLRDEAVAHFAGMRPWEALGWAALYAWAVGGVLGVVALLVAGLCGVWP